MRRIYTSPRIENIERLVAVMAEHGIATQVTNRRAYDSKSYSRFSYAHPGRSESWPAVWVTYANDHTRARQLMQDMGIEPPTRYAEDLQAYRTAKTTRRSPQRIAARIRVITLAALVIAVAIYAVRVLAIW
ncbi:MAG TPA: hypothetical protein VF292_09215 [Rhodanobacteraceae bacterium]